MQKTIVIPLSLARKVVKAASAKGRKLALPAAISFLLGKVEAPARASLLKGGSTPSAIAQ